jgi:hypothetical protein
LHNADFLNWLPLAWISLPNKAWAWMAFGFDWRSLNMNGV